LPPSRSDLQNTVYFNAHILSCSVVYPEHVSAAKVNTAKAESLVQMNYRIQKGYWTNLPVRRAPGPTVPSGFCSRRNIFPMNRFGPTNQNPSDQLSPCMREMTDYTKRQ
jgi:hypothetical protein